MTVMVRLLLVAVAEDASVTRTVNVQDAPLTGLMPIEPSEESDMPVQKAPVTAAVVHV